MKTMTNTEHIEGRIYQHELSIKTVQNQKSANFGKEYISGNIEVAVDEEGLNVLPVHFSYVTETTKSGGKNSTFAALKKIIDENKVWTSYGRDGATKVKIDTALALNDFYAQNDELISLKINEGGFVNIVNKLCDEGIDRHKFMVDMFINSFRRIDGENAEDTYAVLKGSVFNFKNDILPVEFVVRNPEGINYFENLSISNRTPVFTKIWGKINSTTVTVRKEDISAFGEPAISYSEKKVKEWTVTGVSPTAYVYGEENVLTEDEIVKAMQDREVMLAEKKKQREEWQASQIASNSNAFVNGAMNTPAPISPVKTGGFNF